MIIGVDAGCLGITDERLKVGVYQVTKHLLIELNKLDKKNTYLLYSFYTIEEDLLKSFGLNFRNIVVRPAKGWTKIWLPLRIIRDNVDVFVGTSQALPFQLFSSLSIRSWTSQNDNRRRKSIVIFYDLAFEKYPEFYPDSYKKLRKQSLYAAKNADAIIVISEKTKDELVRLYNVSEKKIIVCYLGTREDSGQAGMTIIGNNKKPYFLFVGAMKRIKNVPGIIKGFEYFLQRTKNDYQLLLAGGDKWLDPEIEKALREVSDEVKKRIKLLGFVSDETLASLYQHAIAFVSPSWYEGFGLPVLESMAAGCPVIASTAGSIPEVVGESEILIAPDDYQEIGKAMIRLTDNKSLRRQLIKKGKEQVKKFSWEKFGSKVLALINSSRM